MAQNDSFIEQLEEEKRALELRIRELQDEIRSINNLIFRRKSQQFSEKSNQPINQKNVDRLFFQEVILKLVSESKKGLRTSEIYEQLQSMGYGLNYNTLRSYVAKMRDRDLIFKSGQHWKVSVFR